MANKIKIKISGPQGSGKTTVFNHLINVLESNGYNKITLLPTSKAEDRLLAWDKFHSLEIECIQEKEVSNE